MTDETLLVEIEVMIAGESGTGRTFWIELGLLSKIESAREQALKMDSGGRNILATRTLSGAMDKIQKDLKRISNNIGTPLQINITIMSEIKKLIFGPGIIQQPIKELLEQSPVLVASCSPNFTLQLQLG